MRVYIVSHRELMKFSKTLQEEPNGCVAVYLSTRCSSKTIMLKCPLYVVPILMVNRMIGLNSRNSNMIDSDCWIKCIVKITRR